MRVLLTGGTGFIGSHLARALLAQGHTVRALVRPGADLAALGTLDVERATGDVTVAASLAGAVAEIDAVAHFAGAVNVSRPSTYFRVNVEGTRSLADACRAAGTVRRFVFASSLAAQGPSAPGAPHVAGGGEAPASPYGESKLAAEELLRSEFAGVFQITLLRPTVVFGEGDREMAAWARLVKRRIAPVVPGLELCFLHVADLADLVCAVLARPAPPVGPYFVSDGGMYSMDEVVSLLERLVGVRPGVHVPVPRAVLRTLGTAVAGVAKATGIGHLVARTVGELSGTGWACLPDLARADLGFAPRRPLYESLPAVIAWYREHGWLDADSRA